MMYGVHGAEEIGGGFVLGLILSAAPMPEQAVAEAPKHSHDAHGFWFADSALVVQMRDVQSLVQSAREEPLGFVGLGVKIAAHPAKPIGEAQFLPAIGVNPRILNHLPLRLNFPCQLLPA